MERESGKNILAVIAALVFPAVLAGFLAGWISRGAVVYDRETLEWHLKP